MFKHHKSKVHIGIGSNPISDWFLVIVVSVVVALLFIFWSIVLYRRVGNATSGDLANATNSQTLDTEKLDKIVAQFEAKSAQRAALRNGYLGPFDPSI